MSKKLPLARLDQVGKVEEPSEELVERMAQAMYDEHIKRNDGPWMSESFRLPWTQQAEAIRAEYMAQARAAIKAMKS